LLYFALQPLSSYELSKRLGKKVSTAQKIVKDLREAGLIRLLHKGRSRTGRLKKIWGLTRGGLLCALTHPRAKEEFERIAQNYGHFFPRTLGKVEHFKLQGTHEMLKEKFLAQATIYSPEALKAFQKLMPILLRIVVPRAETELKKPVATKEPGTSPNSLKKEELGPKVVTSEEKFRITRKSWDLSDEEVEYFEFQVLLSPPFGLSEEETRMKIMPWYCSVMSDQELANFVLSKVRENAQKMKETEKFLLSLTQKA